MKKLIGTTLLGLFLTSPVLGAFSDAPENQLIPERDNQPPSDRKRMPGKGEVYFSYDYSNEVATFSFPDRLSNMSVVLTDKTGNVFYGYVSSENPQWHISLESGEYSIICNASDGSIYEGVIYI